MTNTHASNDKNGVITGVVNEEQQQIVIVAGFGLLFLSLICLGSWPALLRLASTDPLSLLPQPSPTTSRNHNRSKCCSSWLRIFLSCLRCCWLTRRPTYHPTEDHDNNDEDEKRLRHEGYPSGIYRDCQGTSLSPDPPQSLPEDEAGIKLGSVLSSASPKSSSSHARRRRPRDARFAYLDYAFAYVISSVIPLLLMLLLQHQSYNNAKQEATESTISNIPEIWTLRCSAMIGGTLLAFGNMSLQWSTTVFAAPLTTVVAIQASLTVAIGTTTNYLLEPNQTHQPRFLAIGVILFLTAIFVATKAHIQYDEYLGIVDNPTQSSPVCSGGDRENEETRIEMTSLVVSSDEKHSNMEVPSPDVRKDDQRLNTAFHNSSTPLKSLFNTNTDNNACAALEVDEVVNPSTSSENGIIVYDTATSTTDGFTSTNSDHNPTEQRMRRTATIESKPKTTTRETRISLLIAIVGGCCFGFFSPALNVAVNNPLQHSSNSSTMTGNGLSVIVANLWFSFAFTVTSFMGSLILMYYPPQSSRLQPVTLCDYYASITTMTAKPIRRSATASFSSSSSSSSLSSVMTMTASNREVGDDPSSINVINNTTTHIQNGFIHSDNCSPTSCCSRSRISSQSLAIGAGIVCGLANLLQFQGGKIVGFATADLVQAYPIISTAWDVLVFGTYRRQHSTVLSDESTKDGDSPTTDETTIDTEDSNSKILNTVTLYLFIMYVLYFAGITFMILSFTLKTG